MRYRVGARQWSEEFEVHRDPLAREWSIEDGEKNRHSLQVVPIESRTVLRLIYRGTTHVLTLLPGNRPGRTLRYVLDDEYFELNVQDPIDLITELLTAGQDSRGEEELRSVMPGIIREVLVAEGDTVSVDQPLFILEAMKMENEVRSPRAGKVRSIHAEKGASVGTDDLLAILASE